MTEKSMLEKCAKALVKEMEKEAGSVHLGFNSRKLVRAVLLALREPDEGMVKAAQSAYEQDWEYGINDEDMSASLRAAIDSILSEPNPST